MANSTRHIQTFASRGDNAPLCALEIAENQAGQDGRAVHGGVGGNADDHFTKDSASSSVGWAVVPPEAWVESAPHTAANCNDFSRSQ